MRRLALVLLLLAPPALAQAPAEDPKARLDTMLGALKAAPDEATASALEEQIRAQWTASVSPVVRLLVARGLRSLRSQAAGDALDDFDAALDLDNNAVDAWEGRARARAESGDYAGAVRDLREVLKREPRHFGALEDLATLAQNRGDWRAALIAWQKLLELSPHTPGAQERLKELRRRALGEAT